MLTITDGIGVLGAALIVVAYLLLQIGRIASNSLSYSLANSLGALAIIFSLLFAFNLSAFVIEAFWLAISLFGIYRAIRQRESMKSQAGCPDVESSGSQR